MAGSLSLAALLILALSGAAAHSMVTWEGSAADYDALAELPGSDFMSQGFDCTNDTVSQVVSSAGKTSRLPVYLKSFDSAQTWQHPFTGVTYKVADQFSVTTDEQHVTAIDNSVSTTFHEVLKTYFSKLDIGVSLTYKNISASVSYDHQLYKASMEMSNKSHVQCGSKMWWSIFDINAFAPGLTGQVHPMLKAALNNLPKTATTSDDQRKYALFVQGWGTHYVARANFGGRYNHDSFVDASFFASKSQEWMSTQISLNFHYDAFAINAGSFTNRSEIKMDQSYLQHAKSYAFFEGGDVTLQSDDNATDWLQSVNYAPHFLNATMDPIHDLCEDDETRKSLKAYVDNYLAHGGVYKPNY